jgi:hypothetical protein
MPDPTAPDVDAALARLGETANRIADERNILLKALRELLGHCEIAAVWPQATGKVYVMGMDSEPLNNARAALDKVTRG